MKNSELNKILCIFLLFSIIIPLFSNFFYIKEGITTKAPCIVDKFNTVSMEDITSKKLKLATKENKGGCEKLEKTVNCDEFYVKFDKKYHPCEIYTKEDDTS